MVIIGFSGKKQSGKTTAVNDLWDRLGQVTRLSFADALKDTVTDLFLPSDVSVDWDSDAFKSITHPCGKTYRELLQVFGTDWCRNLWPDVWVNALLKRLENYDDHDIILIGDCRFPNEVKAIQDLGGKVIRLTRAPFADQDQHESETALDEMANKTKILNMCGYNRNAAGGGEFFDHVLDNRDMSIPEQNQAVWQLVTGWYPELGGK